MNLPLSICIIAKNEEKNIANLLESIRHLTTEIIVVDTGSTDKTKEIAKYYGAKIYDFPWQDNFSLARNESLKYATKDWVLVMEADSIFVKESTDALINCINDTTISLYLVRWIEDDPDFKVIHPLYSLFKNNIGLKFTGRIHEELNIDFDKHKVKLSDIYIKHYGYTKNVWSDKKLKRNEKLLQKSLADPLKSEDKLKLNAYLLTQQIMFSEKEYTLGELKQRIFNFNNKLKKSDTGKYRQVFENFYIQSGEFFIRKNEIKDAFKILFDGAQVCSFSLSLLRLLTQVYLQDKNDFFNSLTMLALISYLVKINHPFCHNYTTDVKLFDTDYLNYLLSGLYYEFGFYEAVAFQLKKISTRKYEKLFSNILSVINGKVSILKSLSNEANRLGDDPFTFFRLAREMFREKHNKTEIINMYLKALELSKNKTKNIRDLVIGDLLANSQILGLSADFTENLIKQVKDNYSDYFYGRYSLGLYYFSNGNFKEAKQELAQIKDILDKTDFFINKNDDNININSLIKLSVKETYFYNVINYYLRKIP